MQKKVFGIISYGVNLQPPACGLFSWTTALQLGIAGPGWKIMRVTNMDLWWTFRHQDPDDYDYGQYR